ncbi:MAG TPA: glycosyltransferase family 4 protein [Verrucomicrobiae bacterium]|nr:glycosyltransferase family 4 protein [Verrucomicrobiae bacterium]
MSRYCYYLAKAIQEKHELLLLSYSRLYPRMLYGKKSQVDSSVDVETIKREFGRLEYGIDSASPASWIATMAEITAFGPEVVILPWWVTYWTPMYACLLAFLKKRKIRAVLLCINVYEHESSFIKKLLADFVIRRAPNVVVHSEEERREVLAINGRAAVAKHLLPLFEYSPCRSAESDGVLRILFFGFVREYKGLDVLLHAIRLLRDRAVSLRIVGEFWEGKDKYLALIEQLGISSRVEVFDGYVPDTEIDEHFAWADLVALPYRRSRTSGIIATAYGFGKPVLATDVGGFREVVQEGLTGKIVPPGDADAFAAGIGWFMDNRAIDFAGNIAVFAGRCMSWRSLADLVVGEN